MKQRKANNSLRGFISLSPAANPASFRRMISQPEFRFQRGSSAQTRLGLRLTRSRFLPENEFTAGGRVAQLGEHLLCKQGVGGSSPPTSTIFFADRKALVKFTCASIPRFFRALE